MSATRSSLVQELLKPLSAPRHPFVLMKFGLLAMRSAIALARDRFGNKRARALFAGNAAHSIQPLDRWSSAAFGLMLPTLGHAVGWPIAEGGSQAIATALASFFKSMGGTIQLETTISSIDDLPKTGAVLFDVTPRQLARLVGHKFSRAYRKKLENHNHGPGVFKVDWALKAPVPWKDAACSKAATLHIGGTLEEIATAEGDAWKEIAPEKPFVFLCTTQSFRQDPRSRRNAYGLGILSRSKWLYSRHDESYRGPN